MHHGIYNWKILEEQKHIYKCKWLAWQKIKTRNLNNRIQSCQLSSWTWLRTKTNSPMNQSKKTLATNCGGSKISLNFWQLCCQVKSANSCRYQWYHGDKLHDFPFFPFFPFRFQWFSVLKFARFAQCVAHFIFQTLCIIWAMNESYTTLHVCFIPEFLVANARKHPRFQRTNHRHRLRLPHYVAAWDFQCHLEIQYLGNYVVMSWWKGYGNRKLMEMSRFLSHCHIRSH